jgi:hypothetical protein
LFGFSPWDGAREEFREVLRGWSGRKFRDCLHCVLVCNQLLYLDALK